MWTPNLAEHGISMNAIIVFFVVLGGIIFLIVLIIAVLEEVRHGGKLPKRARQWTYRNRKKASVVQRTDKFLTKSHICRDRSERKI